MSKGTTKQGKLGHVNKKQKDEILIEDRRKKCTDLNAILSTMATAPGLCTHIIGTLSAPTSFACQVVAICGIYCTAASRAEETPKKRAQRARERGRFSYSSPGSGKDGSG